MKQMRLHTVKGRDGETITRYVTVDDEDYEDLSRYTWYLKRDNAGDENRAHFSVGRNPKKNENKRNKKGSLVLMHHHILRLIDTGAYVRHKDGDPYNMTRENLLVDGRVFLEYTCLPPNELPPRQDDFLGNFELGE